MSGFGGIRFIGRHCACLRTRHQERQPFGGRLLRQMAHVSISRTTPVLSILLSSSTIKLCALVRVRTLLT